MALFAKNLHLLPVIFVLIVKVLAEAKTPPDVARKPSHVKCVTKKYKHCYNLELVCPTACPNNCIVDCAFCQSICPPVFLARSLSESSPGNNGTVGNNGNSNGNKNIGDYNGNSNGNNNISGTSGNNTVGNNGNINGNNNIGDYNGNSNGNNNAISGNNSNNTFGNNGNSNGNNNIGDYNGNNNTISGNTTGNNGNSNGNNNIGHYNGNSNGNNNTNSSDNGNNNGNGNIGNNNGNNNGNSNGDDNSIGDNGINPPTYLSPPPTTSPPSSPTPSLPSPPSTPTPSSSSPSTPQPPRPPTSTPSSPSTPTPTHQTPTPSSPPTPAHHTPTPSSPSSPSPPPSSTPSAPSPQSPTHQSPTPSSPSPPPPTPSAPTPAKSPRPTPSPPSPSPWTPSTSPKTAKCRNRNYHQCYNSEHVCPSSCPDGCEVDCVTCKPVCKCDRPGAVCQDPRFIGGDGITFYFHGKKDSDFCLVSDTNLHINAHFIGKRNQQMTRAFTWVQSIAILFDNHQLYLGALKTTTWDDSVDRLALSFDGEPLTLLENEGSRWQSANEPGISIIRTSNANNVIVEVEGNFKITAKVVPITEEDSRIHKYGITKDDCFAHLDIGFKFYSLSDEVNGVLGQTYRPGFVSRVNIGAKMPVMGGNKEFQSSSLLAADCELARFSGGIGFNGEGYLQGFELPGLSCASEIDGPGVVCKR